MKTLMEEVRRLELTLHGAYLPHDRLGFYSPSENRIYFDLRLTPAERRSVVAHELGHAYHGHNCDGGRQERQADQRAAELLIDPLRYVAAERYSADPHSIAEELGVTVHLVRVYQTQCLQRLGFRTYARTSRVGLSNITARALAAGQRSPEPGAAPGAANAGSAESGRSTELLMAGQAARHSP